METRDWSETFVERKATYAIEIDGKVVTIENVPARTSLETGEPLFSPENVEHLQQMAWGTRAEPCD
jgi:hypothetical protein